MPQSELHKRVEAEHREPGDRERREPVDEFRGALLELRLGHLVDGLEHALERVGVAGPAAWAAGSEVVDEAMFSVVVMMVILTMLVTPPVLTVLLRRQAAQAGSL